MSDFEKIRAISDVSKSAMVGFFKPEDEVKVAREAFDAVQGNDKEMHVIPEAGHFGLYDRPHMYQRHLNTSHHSLKRIFVSKKGQEKYIFPVFFFEYRNDIYAVSL